MTPQTFVESSSPAWELFPLGLYRVDLFWHLLSRETAR